MRQKEFCHWNVDKNNPNKILTVEADKSSKEAVIERAYQENSVQIVCRNCFEFQQKAVALSLSQESESDVLL